jgi:acyl-CoA synthetase (AMP-forming)/AMP-acid ligase II
MITTIAPPIRAEQLFAEAARAAPERVALLYGERTWTFASFYAESRRRARALRAALPPGAVVIAITPMSDDLLLAWLACCHLGLTFCHLSPQYTTHEVAPLAARAAARRILTSDGAPHPLLPDLPALPLALPGGDDAGGGDAGADLPAVGTPEDPAVLATTSGTTGRLPKLAIVPHRALTWRRDLPAWFEARPGVTATTTRGFKSVLRQICIAAGQRLPLLIVSTLVPAKLERELARAQTQFLTIQPAILRLLVDNPQPPPATLRLQLVRAGAAPLPPTLAVAAAQRYGAMVTQVLSTTESGQILARPEWGAPEGSVGLPNPGVAVRLVDTAGNAVPDGVQGEIIARSPGLMHGYLDDPAATADALRDGWYWTGDLAVRDAEGYYFLRGRRSLRINVNGLKVAPEEVEEVLLAHPDIREAVVLGQPDERHGERVRAIVCPVGAAPTTAELRRFCLERLAPYKVPQLWEYRDTLPRSPLGKVLRNQL